MKGNEFVRCGNGDPCSVALELQERVADAEEALRDLLALIESPEVQGALLVAWVHGVTGTAEQSKWTESVIVKARVALRKGGAKPAP